MGKVEQVFQVTQGKNDILQKEIDNLKGEIEDLQNESNAKSIQLGELLEDNREMLDKIGTLTDSKDTTETVDKGELRSLKLKIEELETELKSMEKMTSKEEDKLKQADEEKGDLRKVIESQKEELSEIALQKNKLEEENENLKGAKEKIREGYNTLKENYLKLKVEAKKEGQRLVASHEETKEKIKKFEEEIISKNEEIQELKETVESTMSMSNRHRSEYDDHRKQIEEKNQIIEEKEIQILHLEKSLQKYKEKREAALKKIELLQGQSGHLKTEDDNFIRSARVKKATYNINPERLRQFLDEIDEKLKQFYKQFLMEFSQHEEFTSWLVKTEKIVHSILERVVDFRSYSEEKVAYLRSRGYAM